MHRMLLRVHQFYISNTIMLIFLIIATCLYSVCLVCRVLKNTYFKKHLSAYVIWKVILKNLSYLIIAPMEHTSLVKSPKGKGIILWEIFFQSGNFMVKDKKRQCKRYNVNKNSFYALHKADKIDVINSILRNFN